MTVYLLDNSVLQRVDRSSEIDQAMSALMGRGDLVASSDVSILEAGFSARSVEHYAAIIRSLTIDLLRLNITADVGRVAVELQVALFASGHGRTAGALDLLHAATAIVHDAVVVHYDADFELIAEADPRLRHQWIVPRGSVA